MRGGVWTQLVAALVVVAGAAGCGERGSNATVGPALTVPSPVPSAASPSTATPSSVAPSARQPCGTTAAPPMYRHVVWIVMENRGYHDVVGSPSAPYLASLARACGLASGYSGVAHPSLPNYLALTSGSTHGISDDAGPGAHPVAGPSIFSLLGTDWRALQEAMPMPCDRGSAGTYAVKHNPAAYYTGLAGTCAAQDVALSGAPDLHAAFTLITPDLCHDMHDCTTATGDTWLAGEMPVILDSAEYRSGTTVVVVTWDENDSGGTTVPTYVVAPSVRPGTVSAAAFDHYSLLRTTEELLGLSPLLGAAAGAASMAAPFGL